MIHGSLILALRTTPGGYLCRVQEGEFKYMVAFYDPAVSWPCFCERSAAANSGMGRCSC
jgi:hypothetical protein